MHLASICDSTRCSLRYRCYHTGFSSSFKNFYFALRPAPPHPSLKRIHIRQPCFSYNGKVSNRRHMSITCAVSVSYLQPWWVFFEIDIYLHGPAYLCSCFFVEYLDSEIINESFRRRFCN